MIPKPGDIVDINPVFKRAYCDMCGNYGIMFGEEKDGHIHVKDVQHNDTWITVELSDHNGSYTLNKDGCVQGFGDLRTYGFNEDMEFFVPVEEPEPIICECDESNIVQHELLGQIVSVCTKCKKPPK